jgi:predicted hydrolase (HD superfamily)
MSRHGKVTADVLTGLGFPEAVVRAVLAHNGDVLGIPCASLLEFALTSAESLSGLVVASALVQPSKKLADVKPESVRKRMKEKRFAANVSRERIMQAERLSIPFEEFVAISVRAMQGIAADIGL